MDSALYIAYVSCYAMAMKCRDDIIAILVDNGVDS